MSWTGMKMKILGGLLCLVFGFAVAVQARSTHADTTFATARQDELVGILSDLSQHSERLRGDIRDLEDTKAGLERDGQGQTALQEAKRRAAAYGVLAGTLPAQGPGIRLDIADPGGKVRAATLLDALEELRDAGAEVIQVGPLRAGVNSYFTDVAGGVAMDGRTLARPYAILAIGDPHTMATALNIPGGVIKTIQSAGATASITQEATIAVHAVRST
jgi:uncharacterized protein YlxW (UPF0749 family)